MSELDKSFEILKKYLHLIDVKAIYLLLVINTLIFIIAGLYLESIAVALVGIMSVPLLLFGCIAKMIHSAYKKDLRNEKNK